MKINFYKNIKVMLLVLVTTFFASASFAQALSGVKTIDPNGSGANNYESFHSAIESLNINGVGSGGVTFNIPAGLIFNEKDSMVITATGTAANPIIFQKTGSGQNPIVASDYDGIYPLGTATTTALNGHGDAVIKLIGTSYITFDGLTIRDALGKTTNKGKMEYGIYLCKTTSTLTPTYASACKFVTIKNCTIILDKNNVNSTGIVSLNRERNAKVAVNPVLATDTTGNLVNIIVTNNRIQNCYHGINFDGTAHLTPTVTTSTAELTSRKKDRNIVISNNSISNFGGGSALAVGIYNTNISNAYIENNLITGGAFTSGNIGGIIAGGGFNSSVNINNNTVSLVAMLSSAFGIQAGVGGGSVSTTAAGSYYNASGTLTNIVNINNNRFINNRIDNNSSYQGITAASMIPSQLNINNNLIANNTKDGGGTVFAIAINTSARGIVTNVNNNIIRDNKITSNVLTTTTTPAFQMFTIAAPHTLDVTKTFNQRFTLSGNLIQNNGVEFRGQTTRTATIFGYAISANSVTRVIQDFRNNTIKGLYVTGNSSGSSTVTAYSFGGAQSSSGTVLTLPIAITRFNNNTIDSIYVNKVPETGQAATVLPGSGLITGITANTFDTLYMFNNKISNLYANGINSTVRGLITTSGFVLQIYNNTISELYAPITRSTQNSSLTGMDLTTSSTSGRILVANNTVYLDNNNTDTLSKHRSAAVYTVSGTNNIRLVNNIFVNKSKGNKNTFHVAHMRSSSDFTNMRTTGFLSGRNVYFAGATASQSKSAYALMVGSTDTLFTLNQYQSAATPADTSSFAEDVPFVNTATAPYNLNLATTTATFAANRALPVTFNTSVGVKTDFDNNSRSTTTPDIGAYEGAYTFRNSDFNLPILSYTNITSPSPMTSLASSFTILSATIVDYGSGVNVANGTKPRFYYRIYKKNTALADNFYNTNDKTTGGWKFVEPTTITTPSGGVPNSLFNYSIDSSKLQNYTQGDSIEYFVIAQDLAATPNIASNKLTVFTTTPSSVALTSANFPIKTLGNLFRTAAPFPATITVGAVGGAYASFSSAGGLFEALNSASINKNLDIKVVSNTYETGAFELRSSAFETGAFKITISPAGPTEDSIVGIGTSSNGAMIEFWGTKRVTIDGSFNGSGKYLIFSNPIASPNIRFTPTATQSSDSIKIVNCVFVGTPASSTSSYGIVASGWGGVSAYSATTFTNTNNAKHKNFIIEKNIFKRINVGVYLSNAAATAYMTGVRVNNNNFGQSEAPLRVNGVFLGYTRGAVVDTNIFEHLYGGSVTAISGSFGKQLKIRKNIITNKNVSPQTLLSSNILTGVFISSCDSSSVTGNKVSDHVNLGTTNTGISLGTGVTNSLVASNQISNLYYTGSGGWSGWGIKVSVGTNANDTIFGNTIARVGGDGYTTIGAGGTAGIYVTTGDSLYFYNNSVNLFGINKYNSATVSGALAFELPVTRVRIQNNIFVNKLFNPTNAGGRSMGIIWLGDPINLRKLDNNQYFTDQGAQGVMSRMRIPGQTSGFTDYKSIVPHVIGTKKDSASFFIEPIFVDTLDCHIAATGSPVVMESKGITFSSLLNRDIDGEIFAGPLSPKTNGGGTRWDLGADEFDGIPDNTDRISPNLAYVSLLPLPGQCAPTAHTIKVSSSDASGIDTVSIAYSVNNIKQSDIIMTPTSTLNVYEGTIPSQKAGATVRFRVTAMDLSVNKNKYTIGGESSVDSSFSDADFSIQTSTQFDTISTQSNVALTASISDKTVGAGTLVYTYTTAANVFDRYYGGRRAQYLFTAAELLAGGMRPGKITKIAFETGQPAPKAISLPGFRVDMGQTSLAALTSTYVATSQVVNYVPPAGLKPESKNGRLTIEIPTASQITWDGVSNIVVGVLWSVGDGGTAFADTTQSFRPKYSNTTNQSVIYTQADNQTQDYFISTITTGTTTNTRPNIIFGNDYNFTVNWTSLTPTGAGLPTTLTTKTIKAKPTLAGIYEYVASGTYAYSTTLSCSSKDTVAVTVLQAVKPTTDFVINDSTVNSGSDPKNVVFKDLTTNYPSKWKWTITPNKYTFANGSSTNRYAYVSSVDTSKNPEVRFDYPGIYTVKLVTSNAGGADSIVKTNLIKVDSVYCIPTYSTSSSLYAITKVVLKNMTKNSSAASPYYTNYADSANVVVPQLNIGVRDSIIVKGTNTFSQVAVWMDFNNNAVFETSELVDRAPIPAGTDSNILFYTVPQTAALGKIRMRVVSYYSTVTPTPCSGYSGGFYGETEDYLVEILASLPMSITANIGEQNTLPISRSSLNQQVLRFTTTTSGIANSISLTKLDLNLAGTTNIADIKRIRVYSTIGSGVYATDSLFASTTTITGNSLTLTGTNPKAFISGQNNFWIAVDISNTATIGNTIDISVDSITYRRPSGVGTQILTTKVATPNGNALGSRTIAAQMLVTNDAVTQPVTITVTPGTNDNAMMLVKLTTSTGSPANIVSLKFTSTGSTNAGTDLISANVFYTGSSAAFSTDNKLGATVTGVRDTMEFSGIQALSPGDNYFWLSYNVKATAVVGNVIDASYFGFITQGNYDYKTAVVTNNPAGNRAIDSATCISNPTSSTGDDIASVRVGSIVRKTQNLTPVYNRTDANQTYNNYTTLAPFVMQRAIKTPIEVNTINSNFSLTANRVSVYIDYNNNRKFDDNELLTSKEIPATANKKSMIDTVRVPFSVPNGFYRMRFIVSSVTGSTQVGCGTYFNGETEDYLVQLTTPPPGDYYAPTFTNLTVTPATSQCVATPRTISVSVTDTTGIDTVWMDWKLNNQKQAPRILVKSSSNAYTNTYTTTLPAYATLPVEYSFRALDLGAPYRNKSSFAGGKYEDEYLQVNAGKDQFIKVGDTTVLTAGSKALSNLLISDIVQFKNALGTAAGEIYPAYIPTTPDDDYIEISNISNGNADISGYTIRVLGQTLAGIIDYSYVVPSGAIIPSGEVAVFSWVTTGTDHVNRFYGMSFGTSTQSIYANGYIIKSPSGQIVDAAGTNGYTFDPATTGVTATDWSGNIPSSSNGVVRIANADNNLATDFTPSVAAGPIVTIGVFNTNLPIVPATVSVTWTGGLFVGTKTGASVSTPAHPIAGAYSYVAKIDDNTCTDRDTVVVRVLARPIVSLGVDGSICAGTRILDAGVYPFVKYLWSTGETTRTISVSSAGTYSVTVTDSARNVVRDTINLIGGPAFTAQLGANRDLCIGGNITLTPAITGATTPSCVWSTGATTMAINVSTAGTYSMIATNESGCMSFDTITVTLLQINPVVNLGPNQTICTSSPSTLDAGNAGSTYLWSTGATTQTIAAANAGSYSVIVNTPTGCTLYDTVTIANLPGVTVSLGANKEVCPGTTTTLDAGNAGLTYLWSTGATTQTITAATGTYTVSVTNASGCVGVDTIVVTNKVAPVVSLGVDQSICTSDTITLDAGNAGATYLWSTGATTQTIRVSLANTYTVAVTNAAGCTTNDAIVITNKAVPISTFTTQVVDTTKGQQVKFTAVSAAGTSYAWNFGDPNSASNTSSLSTPTHLFSAAGNYTVTLTVTNVGTGCKSVTQIAVSVTGLANDFAKAFKLVAAPNPFAGNTKINYELPSNANVTLEVYDMIGRKVSTIANSAYQESGVHTYDFSAGDNQNASGVYMVRLIVDGQVAILRVIDIANR
jgi:hypothetical protein